ncbi:hypothetical protein M3936_19820 [Sutcliffiella horikoshii]|uniref:hypothetical protein n=1 Tax=Sutcliffiella horikoshii TaxID=79883 RepID=UPI00203F8586|nr:hypothetical protein [Sutcliffiella horikoshii]MCM3619823.1 hypothetical protein [Sutcliffiella horikoshii]
MKSLLFIILIATLLTAGCGPKENNIIKSGDGIFSYPGEKMIAPGPDFGMEGKTNE